MLEKIIESSYIYYKMRISCPVCEANGRHTPMSFWSHADCGGHMFVGNNAFFKCQHCQKDAHVRFWRFQCPSCSSKSIQQLLYSERGEAIAITTAGQMVSEVGHRWLIDFMMNMGEIN